MHMFRQAKDSKLDQAAQWIQRALNLERAHDKWVTEASRLVNEGRALLSPDAQPQHDSGRATDPVGEHAAVNGDKKYGGKRRADACRSPYCDERKAAAVP